MMSSTSTLANVASFKLGQADTNILKREEEEKTPMMTSSTPLVSSEGELASSYIPLTLARSKLSALTSELSTMKSKHLTLLDTVAAKYETLSAEARSHYEATLEEVKARASLRLKENKAVIEELREEILEMKETELTKNREHRNEIKRMMEEQGKLQDDILTKEEEVLNIKKTYEESLEQLKQRDTEIARLLETTVARTEYEQLVQEKAELAKEYESTKAEYEEKSSILHKELEEKHTQLHESNERIQSLESSLSESQLKQSSLESELEGIRNERNDLQEQLKISNESIVTKEKELNEAQHGHREESERLRSENEESLIQQKRVSEELTFKLTDAEQRISQLEVRLEEANNTAAEAANNAIQSLIAQNGNSTNGPTRVITVPDVSLHAKIRDFESELSRLQAENVELCSIVTQREQAILASNTLLVQQKKDAKMNTVTSSISQPVETNEVEEEEHTEDVASEYEEVSTEEEVEEEVISPASTSSSSSTPTDPHASERTELASRLASHETDYQRLVTSVSELENELKPRVLNYKTRLNELKTDTERKELESSLGLNEILEEEADGSTTTHEFRMSDISSVEEMIELSRTQVEVKQTLAARVNILKEKKKELEENKKKLNSLKEEITNLSSEEDAEKKKSKEEEFTTLRSSMQIEATELKTNYAAYEIDVKDFKEKESQLQKMLIKYKVDVPASPPADDTPAPPRKLSVEHRDKLTRLIELMRNKSTERDALKQLAETINQENVKLKELRSEREKSQQLIQSTKTEIESLPPVPEVSEKTEVTEPVVTLRKVKRRTKKRVKKQPTKKVTKRRISNLPPSNSSSTSLIPSYLLDTIQPIPLDSTVSVKYAGRTYKPITPMTFKPFDPSILAPAAESSSLSPSSSSSSTSNSSDPELERRCASLQSRVTSLETELLSLRNGVSSHSSQLESKELELRSLQDQLRTLTESADIDDQVRSLTAQLDAQRNEARSTTEDHLASVAQLRANIDKANEEASKHRTKLDEMKEELKKAKEEIKKAQMAAKSARHDSDEGKSRVPPSHEAPPSHTNHTTSESGGVDPAQYAAIESERDAAQSLADERATELDAKVNELEEAREQITKMTSQIESLEKDLVKHTEDLASQLAAKEAELTAAHTTKVTELETQLNDTMEKFRITKKKAKELHEALKNETTLRESLEVTVKEREATITSMETTTNEAKAAMEGLKSEVASRDTTISERNATITSLEEKQASLEKELHFLEVRNVEEIKRRKEFQFKYEDAKGKVRVYARVRPFSKAEIAAEEKTLLRPGTNEWTLCINEPTKNYQGIVSDNWRPVEFDHVFHFGLDNTKANGTQREIFEETVQFAELTVQGINCCVFAYGQSGTGKTFTMAGVKPNESNGMTKELLGLKPRMVERIYEMKNELKKSHDLEISCYMLEIYLNKLEDVFWKLQTQQKYAGKEKSKWPEPPELKVRVDAKKKVTIDGSVICKFDTAQEMQDWCDQAEFLRRVRKTGLNEESSRSHLIFAIIVTSTDRKTGKKTTGKLSLVDLAGSERADKTNVEGLSKAARAAMMEEGIAINESLRMLKSVFRILGEQNKPVEKGKKPEIVQYRGNMLTELMQDSLGGNAKTLMFVNVGPAASNINESVDSLAYGDLVKNITNEKASADADLEEQIRFLSAQVRAYEAKYGAIQITG